MTAPRVRGPRKLARDAEVSIAGAAEMIDMQGSEGSESLADHLVFDAQALSGWLKQHLDGYAGPLQIETFKGGQSNPTYKLITPGRAYVMRTKPGPAAQLLPSAHAIEREFAVMRALAETDVPVPAVLCSCEDESVIGRAFYVMEFLVGRVLWDQSLPGMTSDGRSQVYSEMNRVLCALHKVDFNRQGLANFGKPGNYFERQIARWSKQYDAAATQRIEEMDRLAEWLPAHIPVSTRDNGKVSLVHGDFRMDNLMFHRTEPRVIAVLDWELSTLGHPLADLSYHCMTWHLPPGEFRSIAGLNHAALGIPSEADYLRRYCERTRIATPESLEADWNFYLIYNLFRLAAILQGIAKRAQNGIAFNGRAVNPESGVRSLAAMAWLRTR